MMKKAVVHFEIGCSDVGKTSEFYKNVFDWNVNQQQNSAMIDTGREGAISGHINKLSPDEPQKYITFYIETDSLTADLKSIESNGGRVLVNPVSLPDGREFAWFEDVAGNTVGLITQPNPSWSIMPEAQHHNMGYDALAFGRQVIPPCPQEISYLR
jgi:predicted enzyme related to lactoylglutathione lyase